MLIIVRDVQEVCLSIIPNMEQEGACAIKIDVGAYRLRVLLQGLRLDELVVHVHGLNSPSGYIPFARILGHSGMCSDERGRHLGTVSDAKAWLRESLHEALVWINDHHPSPYDLK